MVATQIFLLFSPRKLGKIPNLTNTFLKGLKPPTRMDLLPRKLAYHLKIHGWKTTFLLTWPVFTGHVDFQGCIRVSLGTYPTSEVIYK